ncbi:MAG: TatD family hydrolase [Chloroflexota bacterium]
MLVDTHAHLMESTYADDLDLVLRRAAENEVVAIVCVGYDVPSSEAAVRLAERHRNIVAAVGIHPNSVGQVAPAEFGVIRRLASHPRVVGIGETGLDNYRDRSAPEVQREWFLRHLELAGERGLPVIVHNREADTQTAEMIHDWPTKLDVPGVLHCFAGSRAMLDAGVARGFMVSIAGPVTFKNARDLPGLASLVPTDRLVVETDCPYLAPAPYRGQRNEPGHVRHTALRLAELRGVAFEELAEQTTANAYRLFPSLGQLAA